jgi:hypothetical protein
MRRPRLGALVACALAALAGPVRAAELTELASSVPGDLFDLHVSLRWDRLQERGKITREQGDPSVSPPFGEVIQVDELRYRRVRNQLVPRFAVGLYRDVELHAEIPYVLADDRTWRYAIVDGLPVAASSTIRLEAVDAMDRACPVPAGETAPRCPLFPVGPTTVYHGATAGDLTTGLAWAVFSQARDEAGPTWIVGADVTFPTARRWDPYDGRAGRADWSTTHSQPGSPAAVGEKVWKYDFSTVLARRIGPIEPYFRAHVTGMSRSSSTYSNCLHAAEMAARTPAEATLAGAANCEDPSWTDDAGARLPWLAGALFGIELVPYENVREDQKMTVDVRAFGDYTSSARFYNPLTDASGKLHATQAYATLGGRIGLSYRASRFVTLRASGSLAMQSAHWLTGESLGRAGVGAGDVSGATPNPAMNPNYDWRYDTPGRRFRIEESNLFELSLAGVLRF